MRIEGCTVVFRSDSGYWADERSGRKPYTVRFIGGDEWEEFTDWVEYCRDKKIRIESTGGPEKFTRLVSNVTDFGELLGVHQIGIAWWREGEGEGR